MSRWQDRRRRFRSLLSGGVCVDPGSVFDPIAARIAEDLGFEVGLFAESLVSMALPRVPDLIVLTSTEFAEQTHRARRAGNLPLLCDADHSHRNALNVMCTVKELEMAGVGKMRAVLAARRDSGSVIAGQTSAPS